MELLNRIERFLRQSGMPRTAFGRATANDPNLVRDLRNGRRPGPALEERITAFLDQAGPEGASPWHA